MERDLSEYLDKRDAVHSQVEELINQLYSAYDDGYADGYKQAVDEFVETICDRAYVSNGFIKMRVGYLKELAEKMKGGGNNV